MITGSTGSTVSARIEVTNCMAMGEPGIRYFSWMSVMKRTFKVPRGLRPWGCADASAIRQEGFMHQAIRDPPGPEWSGVVRSQSTSSSLKSPSLDKPRTCKEPSYMAERPFRSRSRPPQAPPTCIALDAANAGDLKLRSPSWRCRGAYLSVSSLVCNR